VIGLGNSSERSSTGASRTLSNMILDTFSLADRVGIVTGGGAGLGLGYVQALAEAGARIVIAEINPETAEAAAESFRAAGHECVAVPTDVCRKESVEAMVAATLARFGQINFIVNNAGAWRFGPAEEVTPESWQAMIDLNLTGLFWCCQAVARPMIERHRGSIINIASISGQLINWPHFGWLEPSYFAAKAGVIHLTRSLAAQWGPKGIRTNAIAPGYMTKDGLCESALKAPYVASIPLGRPGLPADLGAAAVFLASDASSYVNGHTLNVDGGCTVW